VNGQATSQGPTLTFGSAGRNAGNYTIGVTATAEGYNAGTAQTAVTVQSYSPPTGTVRAAPASIYVGDTSALSATFTAGQCGGPLGPPAYTVTEGSVAGTTFNSAGVQFAPAGPTEQQKTITVTARVTDPRGAGTATTTITVRQRAQVTPRRLPDVTFNQGSDRINNCGKRVLLEDLKTLFDSDPGGQVVFVGHITQSEVRRTGLDLKRAMNAAAVISAGSSVCARFPADKILVNNVGPTDNGVDYQPFFCETSTKEKAGQAVKQTDEAKMRRVEVWFVPTGGSMPPSAQNAKSASSQNVNTLGCPK